MELREAALRLYALRYKVGLDVLACRCAMDVAES